MNIFTTEKLTPSTANPMSPDIITQLTYDE
jgi:hypothetical protein